MIDDRHEINYYQLRFSFKIEDLKYNFSETRMQRAQPGTSIVLQSLSSSNDIYCSYRYIYILVYPTVLTHSSRMLYIQGTYRMLHSNTVISIEHNLDLVIGKMD